MDNADPLDFMVAADLLGNTHKCPVFFHSGKAAFGGQGADDTELASTGADIEQSVHTPSIVP